MEGQDEKPQARIGKTARRIINRIYRQRLLVGSFLIVLLVGSAFGLFAMNDRAKAAYQHMGEIDSSIFLSVHPNAAGTKLDSCYLCHSGGSYQSGGKTTTLGSCQWCHYIYGYDEHGDIDDTLNPYGMDYKANGRNTSAVESIENIDSDGDGYLNQEEIAATRYPGDPNDDPTKVPAPYRVFTRDELLQMPQHTQFLLMNAQKSTDFYARYTGVPLEDLLKPMLLSSATGITVISPDGFSQYHPLYPDPNPSLYHVIGEYPTATFHYSEQADIAKNPTNGWCDYSAPSVSGRNNGDLIVNPDGLKMLLAIKRDGANLTTGVLNPQNKLDGEGPFRIVPPQKTPSPPDQRSTSNNQNVIWPYNPSADHNAGFSTRSVTIIRVEPLPEGTTDINVLEAGWDYVDEARIVVYGAINPVPTVMEKLDTLIAAIRATPKDAFKNPSSQETLIKKIEVIKKQITDKACAGALEKLENDVLQKLDGCVLRGAQDGNDWVTDCDAQRQLYMAANEISVLLKIVIPET